MMNMKTLDVMMYHMAGHGVIEAMADVLRENDASSRGFYPLIFSSAHNWNFSLGTTKRLPTLKTGKPFSCISS